MKKPQSAQEILDRLVERLTERIGGIGASVSRSGSMRLGRNVLEVHGSKNLLLYVKVKSTPPGFWGLTKNRVRDLNSSGRRWGAVFLLGSPETGYLVPSDKCLRNIRRSEWRLSRDGDYKVNEGPSLHPSWQFSTVEELIEAIVDL